MKKKLTASVFIALAFACGLAISHIFAASATPGTTGDPLVSKSYVDQRLNEIMSQIGAQGGSTTDFTAGQGGVSSDQLLADVMEQLEIYYADALGSGRKYTPVSLTAGQVILGGEGTEIILRSGSARGYVGGQNGIVNATDGTEVFNNSDIVVNHLLLVPRGDGRGVEALTDAWFMIKGAYEIVE
ncbi:MAG: hypothetical protein LBU77_05760 [Clostridiales bacterium]|jgi:hypothetical protein|nr:hypothetical protein [Clostridiales bacterium]